MAVYHALLSSYRPQRTGPNPACKHFTNRSPGRHTMGMYTGMSFRIGAVVCIHFAIFGHVRFLLSQPALRSCHFTDSFSADLIWLTLLCIFIASESVIGSTLPMNSACRFPTQHLLLPAVTCTRVGVKLDALLGAASSIYGHFKAFLPPFVHFISNQEISLFSLVQGSDVIPGHQRSTCIECCQFNGRCHVL